MKYFPIDRIKRASQHLQNFNSNWVLVPLVFAVNDVNDDEEISTRVEGKPGTDAFFSEYFNGALIGLPAFDNGKNVLRPRFSELMGSLRGPNDFVIHQKSSLWANGYSSRGYRDMTIAKLVLGTNSKFQLTEEFWAEWYQNLPANFRFSEMLIWLYAFHGVPDHVDSWEDLFIDFQEKVLGAGGRFRDGYLQRFSVANAEAWDGNFTDEIPSFEEYQHHLIPSIFENPLPVVQDAEEPIAMIGETDPRYLEVKDLLNDGFAGVIFTGPPGTGKTYQAGRIGMRLVEGDTDRIRFLQFHSSYQYEDFVEGFIPDEDKGFKLVPKHLLEVINMAKDALDKQFVIVIDELSRSDPARVFGEALTYVEMDKRGQPFFLSSGKPMTIPGNIVFLATMNPQDRGVEEVEQAFERRFAKVRMDPSVESLGHILTANGLEDGLRGRVVEFFRYLAQHNNPLARLGHAYFHRIKDEAGLRRLWDNQLSFHFERVFQIDTDSLKEVSGRWERVFETPRIIEAATEMPAEDVEVAA